MVKIKFDKSNWGT